MSNSDFLTGTPKLLTNRFNSVNKYVWETLFPESVRIELIGRKTTKSERKIEIARLRSISDEASTLVFLFLINKFFNDGTKAAKQAVDTLRELNVPGFYIGSNFFSERNDKVLQGERIAKILLDSIQDQRVKDLVTKSKYIYEILDEYKKVIHKK